MKKVMYFLGGLVCCACLLMMFQHKNNSHDTKGSNTVLEDENKQHADLSTEISSEQKTVSWVNPSEIKEKINDRLVFDAKVIIPDNFSGGAFIDTQGIYLEYMDDYFYDFFAKEETVKEKMTYELLNRMNKKEQGVYYELTNGSTVCLYPMELIYTRDEFSEQYCYVIDTSLTNTASYNANMFSQEKDLSFQSRQAVMEVVLEFLGGMKFDRSHYVSRIYSLDFESIKEQYSRIFDWGFDDSIIDIKEWQEEDEAYEICIWQEVQGLPVWTGKGAYYSIVDDSEAPIQATYRSDGFCEFRIKDMCEFRTGSNRSPLLTAEEIKDIIAEKYQDILAEETIVVKELQLCALAINQGDGTCEIAPAWSCIYESDTGYNIVSSQIIYDARTGREIHDN